MRKQLSNSQNAYKLAYIAVAAALAVSAPLTGCSKKEGLRQNTTVETEEPMELHLSCYLTGTSTYTDAEGKEQTSVRFLVENDDTQNKDWVKGVNGKEYLVAGEKVQVYSRYINDNCRYVDGAVPGNVAAEDITYTAGTFTCTGWKQVGEGQYQEIGAIVEDGVPYFYTGCGVSTGIAGERVMCVWLAGFTPDSVPVDGARPQLRHAGSFSLVTADGDAIPEWEGMAKEPELSVNEFGVEVSIQAEDAVALMRSIAGTGLSLRHMSADGVASDFELEQKVMQAYEAYGSGEEATDAADTEAAEAVDTTAAEAAEGAEAPEAGEDTAEGAEAGNNADGVGVEGTDSIGSADGAGSTEGAGESGVAS